MKSLHLASIPTLTGAAEPAVDLVRGLRQLGVDADLRIDTFRRGNLKEILEQAGETVNEDLSLSTKSMPWAVAKDWMRLRRLVSAYELVHTHLSHDHALAFFARGLKTRPIIVRTVHAARMLTDHPGRKWLLGKTDAVVVACQTHQRFLQERVGLKPDRILVDGGCVDGERFHPDSEARLRARSELGVGSDIFLLGCVSRFQAGRRHEVLLEALAKARATQKTLRLALIGHGETEQQLRSLVKELGLQDAVLFTGYKRNDLNDYLSALDAAVWMVPGNDATSRAVLQAMAAGLPVIGGRVDAIAEAIVEGETGLLIDPDQVESAINGLLKMTADRERARAWGEAGRKRALSEYDSTSRAKRMLSFYQRLMSNS